MKGNSSINAINDFKLIVIVKLFKTIEMAFNISIIWRLKKYILK